MPNPQRLIHTVKRAAQLFRSTPGRKGMLVELDEAAEDVLVAGDLHGNLAHFQALLDRARLDRQPRRHLVLQELVHGAARYPGGGCKSHQLVDVVSALKCQYPDRVHFVLGNHELSEVIARPILKAGARTNQLFRDGIAEAYGQSKHDVYAAYLELFRSLPLAVRTHNRVLVCHSHPNRAALEGGFDPKIFQAASLDDMTSEQQRSLYQVVWGRDGDEEATRRFAALVDVDWLVTGHMPCDNGFETPNPHRLILDSSRFPACYCLFNNCNSITLADLLRGVQSL